MKKILALLLALCMLMSVGSVAFADDIYIGPSETTTTPAVPAAGDVTEEPVTDNPAEPANTEPTVITDSTVVANIYLCSSWNGILPHVFVYVENVTGQNIQVGPYTCPPGEGVSAGSFGFTVDDGPGIYFNIEAYRCRSKDLGGKGSANFMFLHKTMTSSELSDVSDFINRTSWWDPMILNCCWFAAMCWNHAGGSFVFPVVCFPHIMRMILLAKGASTDAIQMTIPSTDHVYKKSGIGSSASIKTVSSGSLDG